MQNPEGNADLSSLLSWVLSIHKHLPFMESAFPTLHITAVSHSTCAFGIETGLFPRNQVSKNHCLGSFTTLHAPLCFYLCLRRQLCQLVCEQQVLCVHTQHQGNAGSALFILIIS